MAKTAKETEALSALKAAIGAARTLTTTEAELRAQHAALLKERKIVEACHASEGECVANAHRLVDEHAARWASEHGSGFVRDLGGGRELSGAAGSTAERARKPRLPHFGDLDGKMTFADLCALQPEAMKARIVEIVQRSGARFGLPAAERAEKLAAIDAAIAALEDQHMSLVSGAGEVGITLPHLDAVRARLDAAAEAEKRARELAEERSRGVFVVSPR